MFNVNYYYRGYLGETVRVLSSDLKNVIVDI